MANYTQVEILLSVPVGTYHVKEEHKYGFTSMWVKHKNETKRS